MNSNLSQSPSWTSAQLIKLSQALTEAYGSEVSQKPASQRPASDQAVSIPDQGWTSQKLLHMSAAKSL